MIITRLSYEAIFEKLPKKFILDNIIGIGFNNDRTVDIELRNDIYWKVIRDSMGGIHLFSGECLGSTWGDEVYIEAGDFLEIIF